METPAIADPDAAGPETADAETDADAPIVAAECTVPCGDTDKDIIICSNGLSGSLC